MIIRVLLVDDHPMICRGIRSTLKAESDVAVIAEAGTVEEGMRLACELQPDVVVMGVQFPDGNGIEACRQIRKYCASSVVLILTAFDRDDYLAQAWEAGAAGFILKSVTMDELAKEVRQAGDRQPVWMPEQLQRIHT
jgi:DNA-binding NarL/FixJ family response regulator